MKKTLFSLLVLTSVVSLAQEESLKAYEKIKIGFGVETMTYIGYDVNTFGYKAQIDVPIYEKLGASFSYVNQSSYFDYCDDIPVDVDEQHFVIGLNYVVLDKSRWTIAAFAGLDIERVKYSELSITSENPALIHNERAHEEDGEDHGETGLYTEVLLGLEIGYQLTDRLQLNFSSRLNSYASFRNSFSLFYMIKPKTKERWYK